uniref:Kinesin family member C2 n=1 Tax=Mus musculus TaxID=10090 RepID=A0A2R8VHZ2_MOUSE
MYAFYSLLIYIFYSLFRRDGGAAAVSDPGDPTQKSGGQPRGRRRPDQFTSELWSELNSLAGCSESEDGQKGAEGGAAEVSLEEALMRLAEFLSVQLGAEESCGTTPDLGKGLFHKKKAPLSPLPSWMRYQGMRPRNISLSNWRRNREFGSGWNSSFLDSWKS